MVRNILKIESRLPLHIKKLHKDVVKQIQIVKGYLCRIFLINIAFQLLFNCYTHTFPICGIMASLNLARATQESQFSLTF